MEKLWLYEILGEAWGVVKADNKEEAEQKVQDAYKKHDTLFDEHRPIVRLEENKMNRYEAEELILSMADIVVENRQLRQEVKRLSKVEKEYHDYVMEQCRESEKAVRDIIRIPLENICFMMEKH